MNSPLSQCGLAKSCAVEIAPLSEVTIRHPVGARCLATFSQKFLQIVQASGEVHPLPNCPDNHRPYCQPFRGSHSIARQEVAKVAPLFFNTGFRLIDQRIVIAEPALSFDRPALLALIYQTNGNLACTCVDRRRHRQLRGRSS